MATTSEPIQGGLTAPPREAGGSAAAEGRGWARWLKPSLFDFLFLSTPFWFFALGQGGVTLLLCDGDTGWHIRTGDLILKQRAFLYAEPFSFTKPGQPWFAWEWLTDVVYSGLVGLMGLKGILLLSIVLVTLFAGLMFRHMTWRGANVFIALPLTMLSYTSATVHMLARPHLWTLVFLTVAMWMLEADRRRPSWRIWLLVPLAALWTNLHGGWVGLVMMLAAFAVGSALEALVGARDWAAAKRYLAVLAGVLAASLVNPYGYKLHVHTARYLSMGWIREMIGEFKSPSFRGEEMMQFEVLLAAGAIVAGFLLARRNFCGALAILFWWHASHVSGRHVPLFVVVAVPYIAEELARLWDRWVDGKKKSSIAGVFQGIAAESAPGLRRATAWCAIPFVVVGLPILDLPWPKDMPAIRFPVKMVHRHKELLIHSRLYTEDQWADYLIYQSAPRQKVFFDGRSDFYGKQLADEYLQVMNGHWTWRAVLDKYGIDAVLVNPKWATAQLLKISPDWRTVDDDGQAAVFVRRGSGAEAYLEKAQTGLMKTPQTAEGS